MISDCTQCGSRIDWDTNDSDRRCPRCKILGGDEIGPILAELRKRKVPGQEPLLRLFEILNAKIEYLKR